MQRKIRRHGSGVFGEARPAHPSDTQESELLIVGDITVKIKAITISFLTMAGFASPMPAYPATDSCAAGLTTDAAQFESAIQYDDEQSKSNPTVNVMVNGRIAKMMLDTGASKNLIWDMSLLDAAPRTPSERIDSHVASADGRHVEVALGDRRGHVQREAFYLVADSVLGAYGYSGILSPQTVAGQNAVVIDFERNCFFISTPFNVASIKGVQVRRGKNIRNPHDVMAIQVNVDGRDIPLIVDSGASRTTILASLVARKPKGAESPTRMDAFGAELPKAEAMRLADFNVNGLAFKAHPVIPTPSTNNRGLANAGCIGMDVLKDRIIYYHGARQEFDLLTRHPVAEYIAVEPETRAE